MEVIGVVYLGVVRVVFFLESWVIFDFVEVVFKFGKVVYQGFWDVLVIKFVEMFGEIRVDYVELGNKVICFFDDSIYGYIFSFLSIVDGFENVNFVGGFFFGGGGVIVKVIVVFLDSFVDFVFGGVYNGSNNLIVDDNIICKLRYGLEVIVSVDIEIDGCGFVVIVFFYMGEEFW